MALADRLEALGRFVSVTRPYLPADVLDPASTVVDRAGDRLALSLDHTVIALAGATGSGKSSIFNSLAGVTLSPAGVRRPTTGSAHACVWGPSATPLLDWLKVDQRFSVADPALDGLVLLDLPDFDSVQASHRMEVDRLLQVVDLIVWVMHPQKYADKVVHSRYLQQFAGHADVTVVVLNAADLLSPADLVECVADLGELLRADGLAGVPVLTSSTVGPPGLSALSAALAKAVAAKKAVLQRLSADVSRSVSLLSPLVASALPAAVQPGALTEALGRAAGVPVVASAVEGAYAHRARQATGWPPARWVRRFRPDPLGRLRLATAGATSIAPASSASVAAVGLAVREAAETDLPAPWPDAMLKAARSRMDDVPDALDVAVAQTPLKVPERRWWWTLFGFLQWIGTIALAAGVLWLLVRYLLFALALPEPPMPHVGRLALPTALLFGGLLFGWLLAFLARLVVRVAARRTRMRALVRLKKAVDQVAQGMILAPIEAVRHAYRDAQTALKQAAG